MRDLPDEMSCADLYLIEPEEVEYYTYRLEGCYYNHMPEIDRYELDEDKVRDEGRVKVKVIHHVDFDTRRYWLLATVWLDEKPFMVIQNAGREGDDHARRFITDIKTYGEAAGYLVTCYKEPEIHQSDVVDPDEVRKDLTFFYGDGIRTVQPYYAQGY